jgi:hypothetical protein
MGTYEKDSHNSLEHAKKKLKEETGLNSGKLFLVGNYFIDSGLSRQKCYAYIATEIIEGGEQIIHLNKKTELIYAGGLKEVYERISFVYRYFCKKE